MKVDKLSLIFLSIFLLSFTIADITITPISTPQGTTSASSVNISYNITTDFMNNISFSWNNTNYTFYDDSLVLFYNFDNRSALGENDTKVVDLSKYGNNGTVVGGENISWTPNGKYGGAFNFSGNLSFINTLSSSSLILNDTMSISVWFNARNFTITGGGTNWILQGSNQYRLYYAKNENGFWFQSNNAGVDTSTLLNSYTPTKGDWVQLGVVWNDTHILWYVNGVFKEADAFAKTVTTGALSLNIGRSGSVANSYWNGSLDNLMLFNKSLTANDMSQIYKSQITKYNSTDWTFSTNESTNISSQTYYLCSANVTQTICSNQNSISRLGTLNTNFTNTLGLIRSDFYGVSYNNNKGLSSFDNVSFDDDCTKESYSNSTKSRLAFTNAGIEYLRINAYVENMINSSFAVKTGTSVKSNYDTIQWHFSNNKPVLLIANNMFDWLGNTTSPDCSGNFLHCPPKLGTDNLPNWTAYWMGFDVWVNNITNNGQYDNLLSIEFWNEPSYEGVFLNNFTGDDNISSAIQYIEWVNSSIYLKNLHPSIKFYIGALGGSEINNSINHNFLITILSNWSTLNFQPNGISFHNYIENNEVFLSENKVNLDTLFLMCSEYNVNCNDTLISEVNVGSGSYSFSSRHAPAYAENYVSVMNAGYAKNVSLFTYEWDSSYKNFSCSSYSGNYAMYGQGDGTYENFTAPYNVTKNFAHLCPAGGQVYTSSSDDDSLKVVSCKSGDDYGIIVINTDTEARNVSINTSGLLTRLTNYETGQVYYANSPFQLGILDGYGIMYLTYQGSSVNGLVSQLRLNENQGTTAYDQTGNSNGTISGATWKNDGILITLSNGVDYLMNTNIFTLTNIDHTFKTIALNYSYSQTSESVSILEGNYSQGVDNIAKKVPTILLIVAVVALFGVLIVLIRQSKDLGLENNAGGL